MKNKQTDNKIPLTIAERVRMMVERTQPSLQASRRLKLVGNLGSVENEPNNPELNPQPKPNIEPLS